MRRAFTAHQLLTILRDAGHTIVFIEHDPTLFADAGGGVLAAVGQTMAECAAGSIVILYTPVPDRSFGVLAGYAGQIITMGESQQKDAERRTGSRGGHERRKASDQATLEVF
ncbi:MAG: hypothetical protein D5R99_01475 [Methanocalculus sp. MSAO_Arc1]|nr:MAG: hypothetical protein D5R99_01475 [Methanocalculus sp. MSAO_Arc1]